MQLNARFRERMVGPVLLAADSIPLRSEPVSLAERGSVVGDDIVVAASESARLAERSVGDARAAIDRRRRVLDLDGLVLRVAPGLDARDGMRSAVVDGTVYGTGTHADGPIVRGFADLLFRTAPGERRMYYRLLTGGPGVGDHGWFVIEGVKVVRGPRRLSWLQTTTLYSRVSRFVDDEAGAEAATALDPARDGLEMLAAGILRIHPGDLTRQALSMRGRVPAFLAAFFARLAVREALGDE